MESFGFAADPAMQRWSRAAGVRPENCTVRLSPTELSVTFGHWSLSTSPANVAAATVTGPYRWWKVAGPPRLSLVDRGITFATTAAQGVCLDLHEPVGGIDPLHVIRHPNVTITVAEPARFVDEVRRLAANPAPDAPTVSPVRRSGTLRAAVRALGRWNRRAASVAVIEREVDVVEPPHPSSPDDPDAQRFQDGVGAAFHRRYRVEVETSMSATDAMAALQADLNLLTTGELAPFERLAGVEGRMQNGDRYVVTLAGPWKGPVEVDLVTPHSFRLATLVGHMEAGIIEFSVVSPRHGVLELAIESWARSGNAAMDVLYDRVGVAKQLQSEMWVEACEGFVAAVSGRAVGPVEVVTERGRR